MKRLLWLFLLALFLCACNGGTNFETLTDKIQYDLPEPADIAVDLPEDIAVSVFSNTDGSKMYIANDYTVETYLLPAGDMDKTVLEVTGFQKEEIRIMESEKDGVKRYECVWTSAGEGDLQACRATILDDGNYHYVLTVIGDQEAASEFSQEWQQIFKSYMLTNTDQ